MLCNVGIEAKQWVPLTESLSMEWIRKVVEIFIYFHIFLRRYQLNRLLPIRFYV